MQGFFLLCQNAAVGGNGESEVGKREDNATHHRTFGIEVSVVELQRADSRIVIHIIDMDACCFGGKCVVGKYLLCDGCQVHSF